MLNSLPIREPFLGTPGFGQIETKVKTKRHYHDYRMQNLTMIR